MIQSKNRRRRATAPGWERAWARLGVLALVCLAVFGCKIVIVSGPSVVAVGGTVSYVLEVSSISLFGVTPIFEVLADVPAGWRLDSASWTGTVGGVPASGTAAVVQSMTCDSDLGALREGYRRWHVQSPELTEVQADDRGEVTLTFQVEGQPEGELELFFLLAGGFECGPPEVFTVNREPAPRLSILEMIRDGEGGVDGLGGADALTLDPEARHLYVAGGRDRSVAALARDLETGRLGFVEAESEGFTGAAALEPPLALAVSPDGLFLYGVSLEIFDPGGITTFGRRPSGELDFVDRTLEEGGHLLVSPDGLHLYTSSDKGIQAFARDLGSGLLTPLASLVPAGFVSVEAFVMSPDGLHLYTVSTFRTDVFQRDPATGLLLQAPELSVFENSHLATMSPDGKQIYTISNNTLRMRERNLSTGELGPVQQSVELADLPFRLQSSAMAASPDGRWVAAGGPTALVLLRRDQEGGRLALIERQFHGDGPVDGIGGRRSLVFSLNGDQLYVADPINDSLVIFDTSLAVFRDGFESGDVARWSSSVP